MSSSLLLLVPPAHARWGEPKDFDSSVDNRVETITVRADGTSDTVSETWSSILRETGKSLALKRLSYDSVNSTMKVLAAETVNDSQTIAVPADHLEDKAVASSKQGFENPHQITIGFPEVRVGSKLHLKIQSTKLTSPMPGLFSTILEYGSFEYQLAGSASIASALPLFWTVVDPDGLLDVVDESGGKRTKLRVTLKKPAFKTVLEEGQHAFAWPLFPIVVVSTVKDWTDIGRFYGAAYERAISNPLPAELAKIVAKAKLAATPEAKISTTLAEVRHTLNYIGDWRTIHGMLIPHSLAEIAKSKSGDCKDYSVTTVALLRQLGFKADPAVVFLGPQVAAIIGETLHALPAVAGFNHAIVRAELDGKPLWLDPTNSPSLIFEDEIADRSALVLSPTAPRVERTPPLTPERSHVSLVKHFRFLPNGAIETKGSIRFFDAFADSLRVAAAAAPSGALDSAIKELALESQPSAGMALEPYDPRGGDSIEVRFGYQAGASSTSLGTTFVIPRLRNIRLFMSDRKGTVSDALLIPERYERHYTLDNFDLIGTTPSECHVTSKWIDATREVKRSEKGLEIVETETTKASRISNAELLSPEFKALGESLAPCIAGNTLVFRLPSPALAAASDEMKKTMADCETAIQAEEIAAACGRVADWAWGRGDRPMVTKYARRACMEGASIPSCKQAMRMELDAKNYLGLVHIAESACGRGAKAFCEAAEEFRKKVQSVENAGAGH